MTETRSELLSQADVSEQYGVSIPSLESWRRQSIGPDYLRFGGRIRYRRTAIETWLDSRTVRTRKQPA